MADDSEIRAEKERFRRFLESLAAAPVVDVVGVVSEDGAGARQSQGEALWFVIFSFDVWRIDGGEVQTKRLVLRRAVTEEESSALEDLIVPHE
jgi:hypothetical protein